MRPVQPALWRRHQNGDILPGLQGDPQAAGESWRGAGQSLKQSWESDRDQGGGEAPGDQPPPPGEGQHGHQAQARLRALRLQQHAPVDPGGEMRRLHCFWIYLCEILISNEDLMAASCKLSKYITLKLHSWRAVAVVAWLLAVLLHVVIVFGSMAVTLSGPLFAPIVPVLAVGGPLWSPCSCCGSPCCGCCWSSCCGCWGSCWRS